MINRAISDRLKTRFTERAIWRIDLLIDAIVNMSKAPNLAIVPRELIK